MWGVEQSMLYEIIQPPRCLRTNRLSEKCWYVLTPGWQHGYICMYIWISTYIKEHGKLLFSYTTYFIYYLYLCLFIYYFSYYIVWLHKHEPRILQLLQQSSQCYITPWVLAIAAKTNTKCIKGFFFSLAINPFSHTRERIFLKGKQGS